jgi:hypothetical protein
MAADQAWTELNQGAAVRAVTDQNGERIEYTMANRAGLLAMIQNLQTMCPTYRALALGNPRHARRPLGFLFG